MKPQKSILFIILTGLVVVFFLADLVWGSIRIPFGEVLNTFFGKSANQINSEILLNFRLPKAITAILAGASLSVAGLMMQTLFRNPLADPYILGVSSGASLGVALAMMSAGMLPFAFGTNSGVIILAAIIGAALVMLLVMAVSFKIQNTVSLLIVGIMFGTIASAIVSVLQYFSNPDAIKLFIMWNLGSLSSVTWQQLYYLIPIIFAGIFLTFYLQKKLDALLLGESYASGLGISVVQTRVFIVIATGLLAGAITAFTGPIAFVGIAVPHIARGIFRTSKHQLLIPASILIGAVLILVCDIISQIPTYTLPINTISSLFGAPIIIWIILKRK
ncbi:Transport system permease protein [uncultured Paludibacter sp.]|nr:Transport system permease protein [uncultured Paludibacter sp.]